MRVILLAAALLSLAAPAAAQTGQAPNDYADDASWLCRPGRMDACAVDMTATVLRADGSMATEDFHPAADPPIDCFYVYPTVSTDEGGNSDMVIDRAERRVVEQQLARFAGVCRLYAPMYRQFTLAALRAYMTGKKTDADPELPYRDVRDAWRRYLAADNGGRGVVLIGHSQGSLILKRLIAEEIDGKPEQAKLVAAIISGSSVPLDRTTRRFGSIPVCEQAGQTGCLVAFASYRETSPPPANALFGKVEEAGKVAACVNPALLSGDDGALIAYMPTVSKTAPVQWLPKEMAAPTAPFVTLPGLLSARCAQDGAVSWLAIRIDADPADPRTDDISGDTRVGPLVLKAWGMHLVDINLTMGNLVKIVGAQGRAWTGK